MEYKIKVVFTDGGRLISKLIKWQSWGSWSHCAAIFKNEGDDPFIIDSAFPQGVKTRSYDDLISECKKGRIHSISVDYPTYISFKSHLIEKLNDRYGTRNFIAHLFRSRRFDKKDEWVCSELLASALNHSGVLTLTESEIERITPETLELLVKNISDIETVSFYNKR